MADNYSTVDRVKGDKGSNKNAIKRRKYHIDNVEEPIMKENGEVNDETLKKSPKT